MVRSTSRAFQIFAASLLLLSAGTAVGEVTRPEMATEIVGHGPTVVLESGRGEARGSWGGVARALAPCLTVVTYDRPGIGDSSPPEDPLAPVLAAAVANKLLAQLQARELSGPYLLVGHSLGGLYVQAFARNHPAQVLGMVLVDATSPLEPPGIFVSTVPPDPGSIEAAEDAGIGPSIDALLAGPPLPPVPLIVIAATDHGDTPEREALWRDVQKRTAELSPKGRLEIVESGHFVQTERPEAVTAAVLSVAVEAGIDISACRR